MFVPNLFELSDMSSSAMLAISAALAVFPPQEEINDAAKEVVCSIYSFALTPAFLKALLA